MNSTNLMNPRKDTPCCEPKFAAFVGIDWADEKHAFALCLPEGAAIERGEIKHTPEAIAEWVEQLRARFNGEPVAVAVELARGPLIWALADHPFLHLYPVSPQKSADLRHVLYPSGAKSDPADSGVLLKMLLHHRDRLRLLRFEETQTRLLAELNRDRRVAVEERSRCVQRLTAALKEYFPLAIDLFGSLLTDAACHFLLKWGSLPELQETPLQRVRKFLHGHNCRRNLEERLALIAPAKPLTQNAAVIESGRRKVRLIAELILTLNKHIEEYDARIEQLFKDHPDRALYESLPGAGAALAPRLLAALGLDRSRFTSAGELSTYSGIAPVQISSGKTKFHKMRIGCPKFLRQTFHEFAGQTLRFCEWSRKYYDTQIAQGKKHHQALRGLAFKWQRIIYACWLNNTPYIEAQYLESLRKTGSSYATQNK